MSSHQGRLDIGVRILSHEDIQIDILANCNVVIAFIYDYDIKFRDKCRSYTWIESAQSVNFTERTADKLNSNSISMTGIDSGE